MPVCFPLVLAFFFSFLLSPYMMCYERVSFVGHISPGCLVVLKIPTGVVVFVITHHTRAICLLRLALELHPGELQLFLL